MEPDLELEAGLLPASHSHTVAAAFKQPEIVFLCIFAAVFVFALALVALYPGETLLPTFSLDVADFDGLAVAGPGPAATVNATFDLTLHGVTRRRLFGPTLGICQERGTVAVSYAGAVLAWGRVPKFCVPAQGQQDVRMVALGAGVELSDDLRSRMGSELLSQMAELDVDIMLEWQRYLSCRVRLDRHSSQPARCKVFRIEKLD